MGQDNQNPVGKAVDVEGGARVTHLDGTTETVHAGTAIYQGDVVETDMDGAVNITFNDNTVFAISNDALMTIDEFVYDPNRHGEGAADISVDRGIFLYTSGFVGKEDHDDVHIKTPSGSIGIRGTTLSGHVPEDGAAEGTSISLIEGAIVVHPNGGGEIYLDESRETVDFKGPNGAAQNIGVVDAAEFMGTYSDVSDVAPALFRPVTEGHEGRLFIDENGAVQNADAPQEIGVYSDKTAPEVEAATAADGALPADQKEAGAETKTEDAKAQETQEAQEAQEAKAQDAEMLQEVKLETRLEGGDAKQNLQSETSNHLIAQSVEAVGVSVLTASPLVALETKTVSTSESNDKRDIVTDVEVINEKANHAPMAPLGAHTAFGFGVHEDSTYIVDVSRFFYDTDGNDLHYGIANTLANYINASINGDGLMTLSIDNLDAVGDQTISLQLYAEDEYAASNIMTLTFTAYDVDTSYSNTPNTGITISSDNQVVNLMGGDDGATINSGTTGAVIFGGEGNDALTTRASSTRIFGEEGNDTLTFRGDTSSDIISNVVISGGANDDVLHLWAGGLNNMAFGGEGNDKFAIYRDGTSNAFSSLIAGNLVIDGGLGTDYVEFRSSSIADLTNLGSSSLISIEQIDLTYRNSAGAAYATSSFTAQIDFSDLFMVTGNDTLFLKTGVDGVNNHSTIQYGAGESLADEGFVARADQTVDSQNYHVYYNAAQNQTLYIDADITLT